MTDSHLGPSDPESPEARIDLLCDRFEQIYRAGRQPRIEDFLEKLPADVQLSALRELLGVECELLVAAGQPIDDEDYRRRFPAHVGIVDEVLQQLAFAATTAPPTLSSVDGLEDERDPVSIGRYQIVRKLGEGGFGRVYLAKDTKLGRLVAIKWPKRMFFRAGNIVEEFLREAEIAAKLKHTGLVQVYDIQIEEGRPYIVQEYIDGPNLNLWKQKSGASREQIVALFIEVADAVGHLHQHSLVHRDLKPGNILVDSNGHPHVADFGLAVHESMQSSRKDEWAGTEPYMSPELHRGETHLLDGRSDLWSLGVIFYELLVGRRPFTGKGVRDQVLTLPPKPLRQLDPNVPKELERICLKCLQKRRDDRYSSAADLLEDLQEWTEPKPVHLPASPSYVPPPDLLTSPLPRILPKGLRSFDEHDKDFFLELLPGARDRYGIPESIRFWKTRIEEQDPDKTFSLGLMYGPSGCGKSSLTKAGVLPNLANHVASVYVEATQNDTELRLLKGLRKQFPHLVDDQSLPQTLRTLRERGLGGGRKLLLVLDQFEQWLQAHGSESSSQLVDALRQCDGGNVQCVVLVRGEFLMAVNRFMRAVEAKVVEGFNSNPVEPFDREHAYRVLETFGRAYRRLPADPSLYTDEQRAFLDESVDKLSDDGTINCDRLALFAEMMKSKSWTPANLRDLGGVEGVGAAFLEDRFESDSAPPAYLFHQPAAQAVLMRFLPTSGANIRGDARSYSDLLKASEYAHPQEFEELLHILNGETRLITPCERPVQTSDQLSENGSSSDEKYFQLTHEYLIPSLRLWLTRKKREKFRGRAELDLEAMTADWSARPDRRPLPSMPDWLRLRTLTKPRQWTAAQKAMMASADRRHLSRFGVSIVIMLFLGWIGLEIWRGEHIRVLASHLTDAEITKVSEVIADCDAAGEKSPKINQLVRDKLYSKAPPTLSEKEKLKLKLFLVRRDPTLIDELIEYLLAASPEEHNVILARLADAVPNLTEKLWPALLDRDQTAEGQLRAACALAPLDSGGAAWQEASEQVAAALLRCEQREQVPKWIARLVPVGQHLVPLLSQRFRNESSVASEHWIAAAALVQFLRAEMDELAELLPYSNADSFPVLLDGLRPDRDQALRVLDRLSRRREEGKSDADRAFIERGRAIAAIARLRLDAREDFWSLLDAEEDPDFRTAVVDLCAPFGVDPKFLLERLNADQVKAAAKYTIILALAEYAGRSDALRAEIRNKSLALHQQDTDSGVHFATEYVFKRLGPAIDSSSRGNQIAHAPKGTPNWYVTPSGLSMVVIRGPQDLVVGSPESETGREEDKTEVEKEIRLEHSFAIGAYEVTVEQFRKLLKDQEPPAIVTNSVQAPMGGVNWYNAAKFCRLLSEAERISEGEMVYPSIENIKPGMKLERDWCRRTGYRLPSDEEWECACRAGTRTARFYGRLPSYLRMYACTVFNSDGILFFAGSLRPNPWGLFDVYGNVLEWCHDPRDVSPPEPKRGDNSLEGKVVMRSGSYRSLAHENRSAKKYLYTPTVGNSFYGFRVARTIVD